MTPERQAWEDCAARHDPMMRKLTSWGALRTAQLATFAAVIVTLFLLLQAIPQ